MSKRKESLTKPAKVLTTTDEPYISHYGSPETLEAMKDAEAAEWIARFRRKTGEVGFASAQSWWAQVISDIERIRGKDAADDLRQRMNRIRHEIR